MFDIKGSLNSIQLLSKNKTDPNKQTNKKQIRLFQVTNILQDKHICFFPRIVGKKDRRNQVHI